MKQKIDNIQIEEAQLIFKNFKGEGDKFNREGNRGFSVLIEDAGLANKLISDGWNVKTLNPREGDNEVRFYLQITVSFQTIPPQITLLTTRPGSPKVVNRVNLSEKTVDALDYADIVNADVIISPYEWSVNGKSGVKAYLKTMYVTVEQDTLGAKYDNVGYED